MVLVLYSTPGFRFYSLLLEQVLYTTQSSGSIPSEFRCYTLFQRQVLYTTQGSGSIHYFKVQFIYLQGSGSITYSRAQVL